MLLLLIDREHIQESPRNYSGQSGTYKGHKRKATCQEEMEPREIITIREEEPCGPKESLVPQDLGRSRGVIILHSGSSLRCILRLSTREIKKIQYTSNESINCIYNLYKCLFSISYHQDTSDFLIRNLI